MDYEDLVGFMTDEQITNQAKIWLEGFDITDSNQKWLACAYIYALNNGLKEYQARSFASELTLFLTGKMFNTDANLIYREDWLDSHLCRKYQEILDDCDGEKDDFFWARFIAYLRCFYSSPESWHYERTVHQLNVRLTDFEYEQFLSVPREKNIDRFIFLLQSFDHNVPVEYERGATTRQIVFKFGESVYDLLMGVREDKKSLKFLACLYQYIGRENGLNESQ